MTLNHVNSFNTSTEYQLSEVDESLLKEIKINSSWKAILQKEFLKPYFKDIVNRVKQEYNSKTIYPPGKYIFRAFDECPIEKLKVIIIGQDPYHGYNQANGLCFSVNEGVKSPPSLQNIFKELENDVRKKTPKHGDLSHWAKQGILLLNSTLTVKANSPNSHKDIGWEQFTNSVIELISMMKKDVVFILWGSYAQKKIEFINSGKHLVLTSPHPSPFSANRGFFGNKHFSKTNLYLKEKGLQEIEW